jgi:hypothetical protein
MYSGVIYCAQFPNGKKYYGKTKNSLDKRIKKHLRDSNKNDNLLFHRAIRKYKDLINWYVAENILCENKENLIILLNEREIYWIEENKTYVLKYGIKYGYNLTPGGDGGDTFSGKKHSEETLKKMRESRLKYLEEHGNVLKGRKRPEHSKKMKGENNPMFGKGILISGEKNGNYGKTLSKETCDKIANSHLGKKASDETRKKMSISALGKPKSEETKQNMRKPHKMKGELDIIDI